MITVSQMIARTVSRTPTKGFKGAVQGALVSAFSDNYKKAYEARKKEIEDNAGDSFHKKVTGKVDSLTGKLRGIQSRNVTDTVAAAVSDKLGGEAGQRVLNAGYDKIVSNAVEQACTNIRTAGKTIEELRLEYEAVIRAARQTFAHNPELEKEIKRRLLGAVEEAATDEIHSKLVPLQNKTGKAVDKYGKLIIDKTDALAKKINKFDIKNYMESMSSRTVENIVNRITGATFDRLARLPIIGGYFRDMSTSVNTTLKIKGRNLLNGQVSRLLKTKTFEKILGTQANITNYQQLVSAAVTRAQGEAKKYIEQVEQRAINEIKKYINLKNISIGGFKL